MSLHIGNIAPDFSADTSARPMTYPMGVVSSFDVVWRVMDALQAGDANHIANPANWQVCDRVIIPTSVTDNEAKAAYPQVFETLRPYLRTVTI